MDAQLQFPDFSVGPDARGEAFKIAVSSTERRGRGITLTPSWLVDRMIEAGGEHEEFDRIVDVGSGTGRFALAAVKRWPKAEVIAVENDPDMLELLRHNIREARAGPNIRIESSDYRDLGEDGAELRTLFLGNPPYVRHHDIGADWKHWYSKSLRELKVAGSQLAGMHAHFLAKIALASKPGDVVCLLLPSEWLDTGYGSALRQLWIERLGLRAIWRSNPTKSLFDDAMTTSLVAIGTVGETPLEVELASFDRSGSHFIRRVSAQALRQSSRWSGWFDDGELIVEGVELGELFLVHRGQVTGDNSTWVMPHVGTDLGLPDAILVPTITRARELFERLPESLAGINSLKRVVDIPKDWRERFATPHCEAIEAFISRAQQCGAHAGWIARNRRPWYSVNLRRPAPPIFATYMARRPPCFVQNPHGAAYLNIAHGLYPRTSMSQSLIRDFIDKLNQCVRLSDGRMYSGGLVKFEPGDLMRIRIPSLRTGKDGS